MAGHSKWANIRIRKGAQDAKRGKIFTRVSKEITIAAREAGGDPNMNPRLRQALAKAKQVNLPKDKIETAVKKGTGELQADAIEEVVYEGYGPGGVALLIDAATDNKNRTVADVRYILSKNGGSLGENGCVGWMFDKKGVLSFPREEYDEDQLLEAGLEAGAEDVSGDGDFWQVLTAPEDFEAVQQAFDKAGLACESAEVTMVPRNTVAVDVDTGRKILKLMDMLEDNEDVQNTYSNFDLPEELVAEMQE
jgi:YebC/PmpR family DNA-binding regulatory protein